MKKILLVLVAVLFMSSFAFAQEESLVISDQLKKVPGLKQGIAYSFMDNDISYLTTLQVANWKTLGLELGYSSKDKAVAVISADLLKLKDLGVTLPILDLINFRVGLYGGIGRIALVEPSGNNEYDAGISLTLIDIKF